jgi:hypothetical protein
MSKIYYLSEMEEFYGADEWRMQINVIDIWNKYDKKQITLKEFNTEYQNRLLKYKNDIVNLGTDVWNDVVPLINKMNESLDEDGMTDLWESIYDWADKNDILIKTK